MALTSVSAISADDKLAVDKVKGPLSVMVLGSGGPIATSAGRAGSSYLIFVEGVPRVLMDMGGGSFKSLAKSGTNIANLEHFLLTHLHIDHSGDMSAMVKTVFFHNVSRQTKRSAAFNFYGPATSGVDFPLGLTGGIAGIDQYPNVSDYVDGHYKIDSGVERYLNAFAVGIKAGKFSYNVTDLSPNFKSNVITTVFTDPDGLTVKSIAVNHGPVPAVAYRVEYKGYSIVWSGDTSSKTGNMAEIASGVDILIYDTAIMKDAPPNPIFHLLHTEPARIGEVALIANPKKLVLSHITPATESRIKEVIRIIRDGGYQGKIKVAKDLKVYNVEDD